MSTTKRGSRFTSSLAAGKTGIASRIIYPSKVSPHDAGGFTTVLTGDTLRASLKMRADTSHAAYVMYWVLGTRCTNCCLTSINT